MMQRRLGAWVLFVLLTAPAWSAEEVSQARHRIAWLGTGTESGSAEYVAAFKDGLKEQGLIENKDYVFDAVYADNRYERFPELVRQLLAREPNIIMTITIASVRAAQQATKSVPIVMMSTNDPVAAGLVKSLAQPGGNTTGLGNMAEDITEKYIQLVREFRPQAKRVAVLVNPGNPSYQAIVKKLQAVGQSIGLSTQAVTVTNDRDMRGVFADIVALHPDAVVLASDASFLDRRGEICTLAREHRIALLAHAPDFAEAGCLAGIGTRRRDLIRYSATYVKKILAGARPESLPVELPRRFEFAINVKVAEAIGVKVPQTTLLRADRLVE